MFSEFPTEHPIPKKFSEVRQLQTEQAKTQRRAVVTAVLQGANDNSTEKQIVDTINQSQKEFIVTPKDATAILKLKAQFETKDEVEEDGNIVSTIEAQFANRRKTILFAVRTYFNSSLDLSLDDDRVKKLGEIMRNESMPVNEKILWLFDQAAEIFARRK